MPSRARSTPGSRPVTSEVRAFLDRLAAGVRAALGTNVVGLYVYGSLTQDAFEPRRSDVDCIALLQHRLSDRHVRSIRTFLSRLAGRERWARRLQLTLVLQGELFQRSAAGWLFQFGRLERTGSDGNPIIWMNVRDTGLTLFGPAPGTFLPQITPALVSVALRRELEYLRVELVSDPSSPWRSRQFYRRYAVMTICRILVTHRTGRVVSKPRAAAWTLRVLPAEHRRIVRLAAGTARDRHLPLRPIRALLAYATARLTAPTRRPS